MADAVPVEAGVNVYESQFEQELYELRREKLRQIGALGEKAGLSYAEATFPNHYRTTHTVAELLPLGKKADGAEKTAEELAAEHVETPSEVSIAGRVMAIRVQGKAGFAQLQQGGERIQIYVRKDDVGEDAFALYKLLDLGDHIGVKGYLMRTRTGELTVHVQSLTFLAKAMLALPDKYHGLEDTELRYRQRYVDLFMNTGRSAKDAPSPSAVILSEVPAGSAVEGPAVSGPDEGPGNVREVFVKRAAVLRSIRNYFDSRGYLEVETPMLHTIAGGAAARPFKTHHNALDIPLSLRIAPELYLKRLVVGGMDRVYEINRNFRNEGVSTQHNPEFTMLEFYQAYSNYHDLMELTKELIAQVAMDVNGTTKSTFIVHEIDLAPEKWKQLSMREAILEFWPEGPALRPTMDDFKNRGDLLVAAASLYEYYERLAAPILGNAISAFDGANPKELVAYLAKTIASIAQLVVNLRNEQYPFGKTIAELFEIVGERLSEQLIQPTIIYDFPLAVSPLSKVKPDEPDWVERFEFYIGGFEVGNAFSELNDPDDQRARFEAQLEDRKRGDDEAMAEVDEDYVRALGYGLPPTAGEGIGIDRLTMILTGSKSIRDVILFPLMRPYAKALAAE
jgi:lysyl-tRNA synthetase, class II